MDQSPAGKKSADTSNGEIQGFFASLRMTA
jgi:hypothetical protein